LLIHPSESFQDGGTKVLLKKSKFAKNENGQGLIEYLIIVALMGVAAISVVRVLSQNVESRFANVALTISGSSKPKARAEAVEESDYKKKDLSNFFDGAGSSKGSRD
jgi:pilus assembly protein Flp/PilA